MKNLWTIANLSNFRLIKLLSNIRFWIIIFFLFIFVSGNVSGINEMTLDTGVNASPWILPFMFSEWSITVFYGFIIVLLFCDAPFIEENEIYLITRCNKTSWLMSCIVYTLYISIIITVLVFVSSFIFIIPRIDFAFEWGKIYSTLSYTNAYMYYHTPMIIDYEIISRFSTQFAMNYVLGIFLLVVFFFGSVMYMINLYFNRFAGIAIATIIVLFVILSLNASGYGLSYLSPLTWLSMTKVDFIGNTLAPPMWYVLSFLVTIPIITWTLSYLKFKKMDINILEAI